MEIKDAKIMFDGGAFKSAVVARMPMSKGYTVTFNVHPKFKSLTTYYFLTGQRTKDEPRIFSSIDAAVLNAQKVGFQTITVDLS